MAAGGAVAGIYLGIEVARLLIPVIQQMIESGNDSQGNPLAPEQIAALRAENDKLVAEVTK